MTPAGPAGAPDLAAAPDRPPVPQIALRPEVLDSPRPLVGPLVTAVKRVLVRAVFPVVQDLADQANAAFAELAGRIQTVRSELEARVAVLNSELAEQLGQAHARLDNEGSARQAAIEAEAAARERAEDTIRALRERFDGVDAVLNALELTHRIAIADERDARAELAREVESLSREIARLRTQLDERANRPRRTP